jgi:hypothetical protein
MRPTDGGGPANNSWHINDSPPFGARRTIANVQDSSLLKTWIDTLVKSVGGVITMSLQAILEQDFHSRVRTGRGR